MTTHLDAMHVCETRGGDSHIKLCINVFHTKITTRVTKDNIETCHDVEIAMRAILYIKTI